MLRPKPAKSSGILRIVLLRRWGDQFAGFVSLLMRRYRAQSGLGKLDGCCDCLALLKWTGLETLTSRSGNPSGRRICCPASRPLPRKTSRRPGSRQLHFASANQYIWKEAPLTRANRRPRSGEFIPPLPFLAHWDEHVGREDLPDSGKCNNLILAPPIWDGRHRR